MMGDQNQETKHLFEPQIIAIIGAARDANNIAYKILDNIIGGLAG